MSRLVHHHLSLCPVWVDCPLHSQGGSTSGAVLGGQCVLLQGRLPQTQAKVVTLVEQLGGQVTTDVGQATVVVCANSAASLKGAKVLEAQAKGVPVVGFEWLEQSSSSGSLANTRPFLLLSGASPPAPASPKRAGRASSSSVCAVNCVTQHTLSLTLAVQVEEGEGH